MAQLGVWLVLSAAVVRKDRPSIFIFFKTIIWDRYNWCKLLQQPCHVVNISFEVVVVIVVVVIIVVVIVIVVIVFVI